MNEQDHLIAEAARIRHTLTRAEESVEVLRDERVTMMKKMHEAGISWAQIARCFAVTPQAAMYATGHAVRSSKKKAKEDPAG